MRRLSIGVLALGASLARSAQGAEFITYFQPTPVFDKLESGVWGAAGVVPREQHNGLEDMTLANFAYWDGKIIKASDGKYHLFGSRWAQSGGHAGYPNSVCIHAVADVVTGPYVDKGLCYPNNQSGKGHNVTAIAMHDGRYAILVSDTRPGDLFIATSLDGPWTYQGRVQIDTNGFTTTRLTDNMSIMLRPDGRYMIVPLGGFVMISDSGIMGPYKVVTNNIFPQNVPGYRSATREDPVVWYSGCQYHVVVDDYADRKAMHLTSPDGIKWTYQDLAYDPTADFVRYPDGAVNHWFKLERMGVLLEGVHVTHFTFAAIDVDKTLDLGNDQHGSKIIVVPFDGARFDAETGATGCANSGSGGSGGSGSSGGATSAGGSKASAGGAATGGVGQGGTNGVGGARGGSAGAISATGGRVAVQGGAPGAGGLGTITTGGVSSGGQGSAAGTSGSGVAGGVAGGGSNTSAGGSNTSAGGSSSNTSAGGDLNTSAGGALGSGGVTLSNGGTTGLSGGTVSANGGVKVSSAGAGAAAGSENTGCGCELSANTPSPTAPGVMALLLASIVRRARRRRPA